MKKEPVFLGYCPKCGKDVETDFCNDCGIEAQPSESPNSMANPKQEKVSECWYCDGHRIDWKPEGMIPTCGKHLYLCSNCGTGIISLNATTEEIGDCPLCGCKTLKQDPQKSEAWQCSSCKETVAPNGEYVCSETWESNIKKLCQNDLAKGDFEDLVEFIRNLLLSQRQRICEEIEDKKITTRQVRPSAVFDGEETCGFNNALDEAKKIVQKHD